MNKTALQNALTVGLLIGSTSAMATGFVTIPAGGVAVPGGTSAYITCNLTGDFGSQDSIAPTFSPNGGTNNTCAVPSRTPPIAGYSQVANTVRNIRINNITIGTLTDRVWRSGTNCVYGARIHLDQIDYNPNQAGIQYFEVNDMQRAGFNNRGPISVAYYFGAVADEVLFRAGLTATAVVHQPLDPAQPLTSAAPISQNWVDFTTDLNSFDPDESTKPDSSWMFVKSTCTTAAPSTLTGAIRLRQMGQEGQPNLTITINGYAPAGANTNP
ncbi:MAG: hypothetical protein IPN42_11135 [Methylococcaceae bacterium]|nr:hypothetical protein [Methylococcaceae bacterium]